MNGTIVHEKGGYRVVALGNSYGVGYRWMSVEQIYAAFSSDGVVLSQIDSTTGNVSLFLTAEEMATLIASYQTYLADREKRLSAVGEDEDLGDLAEHPF